ncbi:hypothetical protein V8D89_006259 [Ganoderma adspersum]
MSETHPQLEADDPNIADEVQDGLQVGDAGAVQPPRKRTRTSRSKGASTSITNMVVKRKGKTRRLAGALSELLNMPLDVFFEVAAHLHPLDMLNLARTSKSFRSILLARSNRPAWIASLSTVDALPSCPENLSEPLYAALLFDKYCFLCGTVRGRWVDYAIRLRLCQGCYRANIRTGFAIVGKKRKTDLFRMLPLFPCETGSRNEYAVRFVSPEKRTATEKYYATQVNATIAKYRGLEQQDHEAAKRMMEETLKDVAATHTHAAMVLDWIEKKRLSKLSTDGQIMLDRKSKITERLQVLGYSEDDFPTSNDVWDKLVDQAKPLTDRIWNNIGTKLVEQLAVEKERRIQEAFQTRVNIRLDVIIQWYDDYLEEHLTTAEQSLMPNHCDARMLPSLLSLAQADDARGVVPREAFVALTEQMLADTEAYKARVKRTLAELVCDVPEWNTQTSDETDELPDDVILQRFCAYFMCRAGCGRFSYFPYLTYDELHAHWREAHPEKSWIRVNKLGTPTVAHLALYPQALAPRHALEAVGIPLDTPRSVLDGWTREGRLFCACEHPEMPLPAEMSWGKLLCHLLPQIHVHDELQSEMEHLSLEPDPGYVLRDNHSLVAGPDCCIKFLPEGADDVVASTRTTIDDALSIQIETKLAVPPEPGAAAVCRICKGLTSKTLSQAQSLVYWTRLPELPEEIVWHLRSCHGREFELDDIAFVRWGR